LAGVEPVSATAGSTRGRSGASVTDADLLEFRRTWPATSRAKARGPRRRPSAGG